MPLHRQFALSFGEFVSLIAFLIALTALSIDIMLPALPQIGAALHVESENTRQLVITLYFLGFASGQVLFGPLSDRFGRRPPMLAGLALYITASLLAVAAGSFSELLAARFAQGFGAAAPRVIAQAIVRDRFGGRNMARVMSFVMMVFIIVPILAPAIGQGILLGGQLALDFLPSAVRRFRCRLVGLASPSRNAPCGRPAPAIRDQQFSRP